SFSPLAHWNHVPAVETQRFLQQVLRRWGRPQRLRVDNGTPWGSWNDLSTELALWLRGLDVELVANPRRVAGHAGDASAGRLPGEGLGLRAQAVCGQAVGEHGGLRGVQPGRVGVNSLGPRRASAAEAGGRGVDARADPGPAGDGHRWWGRHNVLSHLGGRT